MNANAKRWIKALRSGKYTQGRMHLRRGNKFCCLGVACDLFVKSGGKLQVKADPFGVTYNGQKDFLPRPVQTWLGLRTNLGHYKHPETTGRWSLANDNDINCKTFRAIAKIIESEPKGLFKKKRKHVKTNHRRAKATA